jgi:hypothetical protein
MQSLPDGDYKFIMHYLDHLTKFSVLKALTSKGAAEVGYQLLDIFLLFGAPHILQSIKSYIYCIKIMLINQFRHFVKCLPFFPGILQNALQF